MDKAKIVPVVLLVIILGVGFVAYSFYRQNRQLYQDNQQLQSANESLHEENSVLNQRYQRAAKDNKQLSQKLKAMSQKLSEIESQKDSLEARYQRLQGEKDTLAEKLKERPNKVQARETAAPSGPEGASQEYWADFIREKAELEGKLEDLGKEMLNTQAKLAEAKQKNRELALKIDEISGEKRQLEREIKVKTRAMRVMSMDLVSEREERAAAVQEVKKLRSKNTSLIRELILASKQKGKLQDKLKNALEEKDSLEEIIVGAENILKEKSLAFEELKKDLSETIKEGKKAAVTSDSVKLPPIVVTPKSPGLQGEVIAVNRDEGFVVVDLGESSGLKPGALLKVMQNNKEIGTLEVVETRRNISAADIVIDGFNIREGDTVISK